MIAQHETLRFANAEFDPGTGSLTVDGRSASLRPRTAAVLKYLLERAGQVVSKDDLLREVWADLVVTENSLAQCVKEIRRELGDAQEAVLKTAHRRGYLIEVPIVRANREPAATHEAPRRKLSLMVMPLLNLGGDPDQDYFAEGLTEELTTDLGRIPGAFVISRGTAQAFQDRRSDAREIGRQLGVRYLVEGSVRRTDADIVVNLSLTETSDACQIWTERFMGPRRGRGELQRSMSSKVAQALHFELLDAEGERVRRLGEANADAHDLAIRAWSLWYRTAPHVNPESAELLEQAIRMDPDCALAWVMKADDCIMRLTTRNAPNAARTLAEGEEAARRALDLEPQHPTANRSLGALLALRGCFEEALGFFDRQNAINPNLAICHQWIGIVHTQMGNSRLAIRPIETCIELSPRDLRLSIFIQNLALAYLHLERDAEALIQAERSVHVPRPWPRSYETLAMACAMNGLMEEARGAVAVLLRYWPGYTVAAHRTELMSHRPTFVAQRERLLEGLIRAGLPER